MELGGFAAAGREARLLLVVGNCTGQNGLLTDGGGYWRKLYKQKKEEKKHNNGRKQLKLFYDF